MSTTVTGSRSETHSSALGNRLGKQISIDNASPLGTLDAVGVWESASVPPTLGMRVGGVHMGLVFG